jgi:CheY-like chemotaxis protein
MTGSVEHKSLQHCRVLVVEDEYFLAEDMARAVTELGAEIVGPVPDRAGALALLSSGEPIDAAVLDINLRGEPVFPVADALRERGVPFVLATGYESSSVPQVYAAVPRWEKPFDARDLARALSRLVQARAAERDAGTPA